jgi:4-hydroxythreonine-4-phosphate dehydrogenase
MTKPLVISLGDPCGTGPELLAKAWQALRPKSELAFAVIGDARCFKQFDIPLKVTSLTEVKANYNTALPIIDMPLRHEAIPGKPDPIHAPFILEWIKSGVSFCASHQARGLITAPIAKSVLYESGFTFPGHTEYLADLTKALTYEGVRGPVMMLAAQDLRVVLATIHIPLSAVPSALSIHTIVHLGRVTHEALIRDFGIVKPRLKLAGLNPHAGESGSLGREEIDILRPALTQLQNESIDILGPYPADTLFHPEVRQTYDAVLCLYHDQGLIPLKTIDFWGGVNITLGLPIVRTSPDHGTGFDIAGLSIARPDSIIAAIEAAHKISQQRHA